MKAGEKVWLGPWSVVDDGEAILCESPLMDDRVGDFLLCPPESELIPDHPALPAVARWLAGLPEWLDVVELASALETVLVMSKEGQAMTCHDAVPVLYERQGAFVEASDNIKPHGWEALESLIAALTEATR